MSSTERFVLGAIAAATITAAAFNATLIFDDLFFAEYFRFLHTRPLGQTFEKIFFILDLGAREYRLYGLSKLLHVVLFWIIDTRAWGWGTLIAATQALAAWALFLLLVRLRVERALALTLAVVWMLSPFAATSCFHHYSYLILPYQLTIACALVLTKLNERKARVWVWRPFAAVLGFAIATTGETHLAAAPIVLALTAWAAPSERRADSRFLDWGIPVAAMVLTIVAHRLAWSALVPPADAGERYAFAVPSLAAAAERAHGFLLSLPLGASEQITAIIRFAGLWGIATGVGAPLVFLLPRPAKAASLFLPLSFASVAGASFLVVLALSVFTGQVSVVYPRRYGYVPYTLAAMTLIAAAGCLPWGRRVAPIIVAAAVAWPWVTLEAIDLPRVRAQDARVYRAVRDGIAHHPSVLIANAWRETVQPGQPLSIDTPGLRSLSFPETFESPLGKYWWMGHYFMVVLGASFVGDRAIEEGESVRLIGNNMGRPPWAVVPRSSVTVVADPDPKPPAWDDDPSKRVNVSAYQ